MYILEKTKKPGEAPRGRFLPPEMVGEISKFVDSTKIFLNFLQTRKELYKNEGQLHWSYISVGSRKLKFTMKKPPEVPMPFVASLRIRSECVLRHPDREWKFANVIKLFPNLSTLALFSYDVKISDSEAYTLGQDLRVENARIKMENKTSILSNHPGVDAPRDVLDYYNTKLVNTPGMKLRQLRVTGGAIVTRGMESLMQAIS
jgi:hypothetical protein